MNQVHPDAVLDQIEHPLILSSRVLEQPVFNRAGDRLGHIDDLSIEKASGRIVYAIMSFGGFLGVGTKFHPVPWILLDFDPERGGFVVPLDKPALENAPSYDSEELRALGGADYRATILGYYGPYGVMPY